jgi:hypothetical protein
VNHLAGLRKAATEVERPAHLGRLEITFMQSTGGGGRRPTPRRPALDLPAATRGSG